MTLKVKATKAQVDECDYTKLTSFCTAEEIINRVKKQPMAWEKFFANHTSDKGQYPKYIKNSYNSIVKRKKQSKKMGKIDIA